MRQYNKTKSPLIPFKKGDEDKRKPACGQRALALGFTLVELIVVISILAVLGTIAFISFQSYTKFARDTVRVADLGSISRAISIKISQGGYVPKPEEVVEITSSGITVMYQGEFTRKMGSKFGINGDLVDPLDGKNYTYSTDANFYKHELAGFLEGETASADIFKESYAGIERMVVTKGDKLGIIFTPEEVPLQEITLVNNTLDIVNTTDSYKVYFDNNNTLEGTGSILLAVNPRANCKRILETGLVRKGDKADGMYTINPVGKNLDVYCDMTTEGGGWTLVANWSTLGQKRTFPGDTELLPSYSTGTYSVGWEHGTNYYMTFVDIPFEDINFVTGNKEYYCGFNYLNLFSTRHDGTNGYENATIKYAQSTLNTIGESTNSLWRETRPEDPWIGCAGTHNENSYVNAMTFWGEANFSLSGVQKHADLAEENNGIGVFIK